METGTARVERVGTRGGTPCLTGFAEYRLGYPVGAGLHRRSGRLDGGLNARETAGVQVGTRLPLSRWRQAVRSGSQRGNIEDLDGLALGSAPSAVVSTGGVGIGVASDSLDGEDIDASIQQVGNV